MYLPLATHTLAFYIEHYIGSDDKPQLHKDKVTWILSCDEAVKDMILIEISCTTFPLTLYRDENLVLRPSW